tara:strand:+ start:945 stop:1820 length:876 start_codon:yes stop_codon:yes gene_type:complete
VSGFDNKEKNDICVISYPDYKDTEIYMKVINQLRDLSQDFIEIDLDTFDIGFNKSSHDPPIMHRNVISVGGDGTALKGMYLSYLSDSTLLPLGSGEIGYLVNSDKRKHQKLIKSLADNNYESQLSTRTVIGCPTISKDWPIFNEFAITKSGNNTLLEFNIEFNKESIYLKSDGILISTSGGSTAYSYSAGGPIVDPSIDSVVITPLAPFSKFPRSIVLPSSTDINIDVDAPQYSKSDRNVNFDVFFDGVLVNNFSKVTTSLFKITKKDRTVKILGLNNQVNVNEFLSQILR